MKDIVCDLAESPGGEACNCGGEDNDSMFTNGLSWNETRLPSCVQIWCVGLGKIVNCVHV